MKNFINRLNNFYIALIILAIILISHIDIIFAPLGQYFSNFDVKDLGYYVNIRQYAFDSLLSGIFPLWTTKLYCGIPFFANSETAILYLPNIIFFILPLSKAFNLSFILHFFILSFSVFLWIDNKIKDKFISIIVAIASVFFSTIYLHACASHLSNITTVVWFPLLLYFYDKTFEKKKLIFILPISFILSLQIFAGHLQYIYYSALVSLIYILFFCRNKHVFITIISSYLIALLLTAIQLIPSFDFYLEGIRKTGILNNVSVNSKLAYLISLFFPKLIICTDILYWETGLYFGICSTIIMFVAIFTKYDKFLFKNILLVLVIYLLSFKTISDIANNFIPFFSWFRSPVKFMFFVSMFLLPILAYGIKYLFSKDIKMNKYCILLICVCSIVCVVFSEDLAKNLVRFIKVFFEITVKDANNIGRLLIYYGCFIFIFCILLSLKKYLVSRILICILLVVEPIIVMKSYSKLFVLRNNYTYNYTLKYDFNEQVRFFSNNYYSLKYNAENISGSVPDTLANYYIFADNLGKDFNSQNMFGILRCQYIVENGTKAVEKMDVKTLNRINVFYNYKLETNKEKIYEILSQRNFDIFDTVILEKQPQYGIKDRGEYKLTILYFDENSIEFECETTQPAIVLYTDNYSKGWKAYNIDNPKEKYEIICADYIYKALSINEGKHKIRIEYRPLSFIIGMWISILSWLIFVSFCIFFYIRKRKYSI